MLSQQLIYSASKRKPNGEKEKIPKKVYREAHKKAVEEQAKDREIETKKIDRIVQASTRELYQISSVFPFDLFPDKLIIDESKITFIFKDFFMVERVQSVYLKDISDCIVQVSVFFASLSVVDLGFRDNWLSINFLKIDEALQARRIIQGLMVARKLELEIEHIPQRELITKLDELGKASTHEPFK